MKVLSLFSGAGGLDLGLIQAGNTVIWANDIDANAVETYRKNIGTHIVLGDIKNIDISKLPKVDVVVGGFPCQGFSQANRSRMLDDEKMPFINSSMKSYTRNNLIFSLQKTLRVYSLLAKERQ